MDLFICVDSATIQLVISSTKCEIILIRLNVLICISIALSSFTYDSNHLKTASHILTLYTCSALLYKLKTLYLLHVQLT